MRAVILSGGTLENKAFLMSLLREDDCIICADSGYAHAQSMGLSPYAVIGDFDSLGYVPEAERIVQSPSRKDETDTEMAMTYAREQGFREFLLIACTGTRIDHSLTNILMLGDCLKRGESAQLADGHNLIQMFDREIMFGAQKGSILSLLPITTCTGVTTYDLDYPLLDATLYVGKGLGVSNVMQAETGRVTIKSGIILAVLASDAPFDPKKILWLKTP